MRKQDFDDLIQDARVRIDDLERWNKKSPIYRKSRTIFATDKLCDFIEAVEWLAQHDRLTLGNVNQPEDK